jgi:Xaa-Pro aminopeptidase
MNEHYRAVETETREARFVKWWKDNIQHIPSQKQPILQRIRCKRKRRIRPYNKHVPLPKRIQKSSIFVKPNVMEYEIEAEFIHEFTQSL